MSERLLYVLEPWHDYGLDLRSRRVYLHSPILASEERDVYGTDKVVKNLLWLDSVSADPVELWINSPGGTFVHPGISGNYRMSRIDDRCRSRAWY